MGQKTGGAVRMLSNRPVQHDPAEDGGRWFVKSSLDPDLAAAVQAELAAIYSPTQGPYLSASGYIATLLELIVNMSESDSLTRDDVRTAVKKAIRGSLEAADRLDPIREALLA